MQLAILTCCLTLTPCLKKALSQHLVLILKELTLKCTPSPSQCGTKQHSALPEQAPEQPPQHTHHPIYSEGGESLLWKLMRSFDQINVTRLLCWAPSPEHSVPGGSVPAGHSHALALAAWCSAYKGHCTFQPSCLFHTTSLTLELETLEVWCLLTFKSDVITQNYAHL